MDPVETAKGAMRTCSFCGVATETAHETQEACIRALHAEIERMRAVLERVYSAAVPEPPDDDPGPDTGSAPV
jgi:hypothetical protein